MLKTRVSVRCESPSCRRALHPSGHGHRTNPDPNQTEFQSNRTPGCLSANRALPPPKHRWSGVAPTLGTALLPLALPSYPWRCLCRGSAHTTYTTPRRRTILHFSHMRRTLARTFMARSGGPTVDRWRTTTQTVGDPKGHGRLARALKNNERRTGFTRGCLGSRIFFEPCRKLPGHPVRPPNRSGQNLPPPQEGPSALRDRHQ
jgi:hypothetical protein